MTKGQESNDVSDRLADEWAQAWMDKHLPELKQSVSGQRLLYQSLVIGFVVGLAAHVGGYILLASLPDGLLGLLADLLHALGWSLWTGVVVAVFVQVIPQVKRRQIRQAIDAYEAMRREQAPAGGSREAAVLEKSQGEQGQK
jgi:hypothetical protein